MPAGEGQSERIGRGEDGQTLAAARFRLENERKQEGTRDGSQRVLGRQNTCIWTGYNDACLYHLDDAHRAIKTAYFKSQIGFENTF